MKRIVRYIMIAGLMAVLSAPVVEARDGRQGRGGNGGGTRTEQSRNSGNNSPGRRGGNSGGGHQQGNRPGGGNQPGSRPGSGQQPGNRPGGGNQPGNRPSGGHQSGNRPGNHNPGHQPAPRPGGHGPSYGHGPGPGPAHNGYRPAPPPPPRHDYWPRYHRPTPPPHYVCHGHGPSFGSILGMVLGTAYNVSLNYLYSNGYNVAGYGDNAIYLTNVGQMNYNWPNAVLYYNNGMLTSSQYIYSTSWHDTGRYNMLYNSFFNQYGAPVSVDNSGIGMRATWFGYDGRFVTIQYSAGWAANGSGCYYTTLSFGN